MKRLFAIVFLVVGIIPTTSFSVQQVHVAEAAGPLGTVEATPLDPVAKRMKELAERFPDSCLKNRFQSAGSTRLLLEHHAKPLKITAFENGSFEIQLTREFSADDIDGLADNHPELLKYAEAFPRSLGDNTDVRVKIETEVTYLAKSEREFEQAHPEFCELYREFKDAPFDSADSSSSNRVAALR